MYIRHNLPLRCLYFLGVVGRIIIIITILQPELQNHHQLQFVFVKKKVSISTELRCFSHLKLPVIRPTFMFLPSKDPLALLMLRNNNNHHHHMNLTLSPCPPSLVTQAETMPLGERNQQQPQQQWSMKKMLQATVSRIQRTSFCFSLAKS